MKKRIISALIIITLILSLIPAITRAVTADTATPPNFKGWYCVNYNSEFHVSSSPITVEGKASSSSDGNVFNLRTFAPAGEYTESGIALYVDGSMKLGDFSTLGIAGSGDDYAVNLWLDVGGDGKFFAFDETGNMTGLADDYYGQINSDVNGVFKADDTSTVKLQYGHGSWTIAQLKAGDCPNVTGNTMIAFWIGVYENHPMTNDIKTIYVNGSPEVWVDDEWVGKSLGDDAGGHTFGLDAFASIQDGIAGTAIGGTVNVEAGTYTEPIHIDVAKTDLTLKAVSDNPENTTIRGGPIAIRGEGTTLDGFTLDLMGRELQISSIVWAANTDIGPWISGVTLKNNIVTNGYIQPFRAENLEIIHNQIIHPSPNGIAAYGSFNHVRILDNNFSGGPTDPGYTWENIFFTAPGTLTDVQIQGNQFSQPNNRPHIVDLTGDLNLDSILKNNVFDRAVVIDRPDSSFLNVVYSSIQAAISGQSIAYLRPDGVPTEFWRNLIPSLENRHYAGPVMSGDIVLAGPGIYDEQIVTDKAITIQGAGDTTVIKPSSFANLSQHFTVPWVGGTTEVYPIITANSTSGNITVKNLAVDGQAVVGLPGGIWLAGILYQETGGTIDSDTVYNIGIGTDTGVRGQGIVLSAIETDPVTVEVKNSHISNYDKNGITAIGAKLTAYIHDNEVVGRGVLHEGDECQNGILIIDDAVGSVNDNAVSNHAYIGTPGADWGATGVCFLNASGSAEGNTSNDNEMGVVAQIADYLPTIIQTVTFARNTVNAMGLLNPELTVSGINAATYVDDAFLNVVMESNTLDGGPGDGISIGDTEDNSPAGTVIPTITNNLIYGWATDISNLTDIPVDAINNWWGSNKGLTAFSGNVSYDPWLVLGISATPTGIEANGTSTSTITADMTKNSKGDDTSASGYIPDGTQITFTTNKGSIIGTKTVNGIATATLTSSANVETATVKASAPPHTNAATAATTVFFTKAGVKVEKTKTEETTSGNVTVDAKTEASTEVEKKGNGTPTITVAKYDKNPGAGFSGATNNYIDVHADNVTDVDEIVIKLYYTNADISGLVESSLKLRWWDGTAWTDCSESGVTYPTGGPTYRGYMWARITSTSMPTLSELSGTVFGGGGETTPAPTQEPSGGGGGGGMPRLTTNLFGKTAEININYLGVVQKEIKATSEDGKLTVVIPKGTKVLNKSGEPLYNLTAKSNDSPPNPPEDSNIIGLAYDFDPAGANFQPGITFTWSYDPAALPKDVSEKSLVIAYFDTATGKWVKLDSKVDMTNHTITASVTHFTTFAVFGTLKPVTTPPATTPVITRTSPVTSPPATTPVITTTQPVTTPPSTTPEITTTPVTPSGPKTSPISTPIGALPAKPMATYWWWIIGVAVVIVICVSVFVLRRKRD